MLLNIYQTETLGVLPRFLEDARLHGPKATYEAITQESDQAKRLRGYGGKYEPLLGQEDMPYVCLRLPTGGGKTLLAAHAVGVARDAWIDAEFPLVLWLVPTNMVRTQTVDALNNPRHPYHAALDDKFGGRVRIYDIADFGRIRAHDLAGNCCVVVGTLQTLRVESTDGRKVYAHHEELEPLFSQVPRHMAGLETLGADMAAKVGGHPDDIRYSFANLCHLRRPLMIVGEAHKAVTGLSREMHTRVPPCAIIEFMIEREPQFVIAPQIKPAPNRRSRRKAGRQHSPRQPPRSRYRIGSTIRRSGHLRGRPTWEGGGKNGSSTDHSASVKSLGKASPALAYCARVVSVHIVDLRKFVAKPLNQRLRRASI